MCIYILYIAILQCWAGMFDAYVCLYNITMEEHKQNIVVYGK